MSGTILITGASRGIGLALSIAFARNAWTVFAAARQPRTPLLEQACQDHSSLHPLALDVLDDASAADAFAAVAGQADALDVLVNNAAIFPGEGDECLHELDLSWFGEAMETNVTGVARVTRAALPLLRRGPRPRVANISSSVASIGAKDDYAYYPYAVSKAALNMLTRAIAAEFRPEGIAVAAFHPGWVQTEMGGPNATLTVDESSRSLQAAIARLEMKDAGQFLDRDGRPLGVGW